MTRVVYSLSKTASLKISSSTSGVKSISFPVLGSSCVVMEMTEKLNEEYPDIDTNFSAKFRKLANNILRVVLSFCTYQNPMWKHSISILLVTMLLHHTLLTQPMHLHLVYWLLNMESRVHCLICMFGVFMYHHSSTI